MGVVGEGGNVLMVVNVVCINFIQAICPLLGVVYIRMCSHVFHVPCYCRCSCRGGGVCPQAVQGRSRICGFDNLFHWYEGFIFHDHLIKAIHHEEVFVYFLFYGLYHHNFIIISQFMQNFEIFQ